MDTGLLDQLFTNIPSKKIAVIGDFALDFYFNLETKTNEFSVETAKEVFHASAPNSSLGGAGNVCKNLAHLGAKPTAFGVIGEDLFGREMLHQMNQLGILSASMKIDSKKGTPVYSKPMQGTEEYNRIDFGTKDVIEKIQRENFIENFCQQIHQFDGIILNEQFLFPLLAKEDINNIQQHIRASKVFAIADFRSLGSAANEVILKINLKEFCHLLQMDEKDIKGLNHIFELVQNFIKKRNKGILLTLGELGILYADHTKIVHQPAIPVNGPIDTVGAGDMVVAAFTAAMLSGLDEAAACEFATICAHISIHKIGETGAANWQEIMMYYK